MQTQPLITARNPPRVWIQKEVTRVSVRRVTSNRIRTIVKVHVTDTFFLNSLPFLCAPYITNQRSPHIHVVNNNYRSCLKVGNFILSQDLKWTAFSVLKFDGFFIYWKYILKLMSCLKFTSNKIYTIPICTKYTIYRCMCKLYNCQVLCHY